MDPHLSMSEALAILEPSYRSISPSGQDERQAFKFNKASKIRAAKKRASQACCYCRSKKIKCSLVKSGSPCNTCQLDEVECIVTKSMRNRGRRHAKILSDRLVPPLPTDLPHLNATDQVPPPDEALEASESISHKFSGTSIGSVDWTYYKHVPKTLFLAPQLTYSHTESDPINSSQRQLQEPLRPDFYLPRYVRPTPPGIAVEDLVILANRGVFELPHLELQNELLQKYAEYVHPLLPVLDLHELLKAVYSGDDHVKISLMLLCAILSAAASFADLHVLIAAGFPDRKAARKAFFQKAKLLYDCDYETDRMSLVQALLLMTYWYETPYDRKDPSYWMEECLFYAYSIGLHEQTHQHHFDVKMQKLRKRLWWCCYMRDQLIAFSQRKSSRIATECNIQLLAIDDYDTQPLKEDMLCPFGESSAIADLWTRTTMAKLCIEKVKLCICIRHILATHYSETIVNVATPNMATESVVLLTARRVSGENIDIINCEQLLDEWNENLPLNCYFRVPPTSDQEIQHLEVLSVHRNVLNMLYLTALSAFHRPRLGAQLPSLSSGAFNLRQLSLKKVKEAAINTIAIAMDLHKHDASRFLPPIGVTILSWALITHLLELKAKPTWENPSLRRFHQGVEVLQTMRDAFWSADYTYSFFDDSVRRSKLELMYGDLKIKVQGIADLMEMAGLPKAQIAEDVESQRLADNNQFVSKRNTEFAGTIYREDAFESSFGFEAFADCFGLEAGLSGGLEELWNATT